MNSRARRTRLRVFFEPLRALGREFLQIGLGDIAPQFERRNAKRCSEVAHVERRNVPFSALDEANVIAVRFCECPELVLRQSAFHAETPNGLAEDYERISAAMASAHTLCVCVPCYD